jgi:hypothetical protein
LDPTEKNTERNAASPSIAKGFSIPFTTILTKIIIIRIKENT